MLVPVEASVAVRQEQQGRKCRKSGKWASSCGRLFQIIHFFYFTKKYADI
jgi:hypothetical protein